MLMGDYARTAFSRLGFKALSGFNSGGLLGFAEFTMTIDPHAQIRSSSDTSFLQTALRNFILQLYIQTLTTNIFFSENKTATEVSVVTGDKFHVFSARREVILAVGAVSLRFRMKLMGFLMENDYSYVASIATNIDGFRRPAATLARFDIPVLSDLQGVGQNLRVRLT